MALGIAKAMEDAMRRHLTELLEIQQHSLPPQLRMDKALETGNVLAVVNFPDDPGRDCNGIADFGKTYKLRLDYDRLVRLGSTKINDMLKPRKQERYRRLLKMDALPDGVDYVLDFTPPSEGEECSELTASLWLPECTKIWWMAGHYKPSELLESGHTDFVINKRPLAASPVGAVLTLGHDDQCPCSKEYSNITDLWARKDDVKGIYPTDGSRDSWVPPFRRNLKDYCRVRHCMNILRILRAIGGKDLLVNSATRMWTLANLAVHLDVVSVVRDTITQWFSAAPNTKFIEMFPEESFKIALALQMRDVLLMSFKILVNERAVDHLATTSTNPSTPSRRPPKQTWMERERTDYGDLPEDPVEHASRAFADRLKAKLDVLRGDKAFDSMMGAGEWGKLQFYSKAVYDASAACAQPSPVLLALLSKLLSLMEALLSVFHSYVANCLVRPPPERLDTLISAQRAHAVPELRQTPTDQLLALLNDHQKACLPFFWYHLRDQLPEYPTFRYRCYQKAYLKDIAEAFNNELYAALDRRLLKIDLPALQKAAGGVVPAPVAFSEESFHAQMRLHLARLSYEAVGYYRDGFNGDGGSGGGGVETTLGFFLSDHLLLTLEESETKYLPLWAGGFDDGSGGVFQDEVPPTDMGPSEPGPMYHTGQTVASCDTDDGGSTAGGTGYAPSISGSSFSDLGVGNLKLASTAYTGGSNVAQDSGASTVYAKSEVVSLDDSEAFTSGDEASMRDAMFAVPDERQGLGRAVEYVVDGVGDGGIGDEKGGEGVEEDEGSYIFGEEEGGEDEDEDAMDTDSTLSAGDGDQEDDDLSDFDMV
ncbi:hypothetical protein GE09DRAFT_1054219 [Coniochaeta sp. 2T2.1]|nr:hypothetical protein GE09DRAFT_1054219 [Coniochaeta sp. 2T2.1]